MLLGDVDSGRVLPKEHFRHISRLAAGLAEKGRLCQDRMEDTARVLADYHRIIREAGISEYHAVATAALRHADNRNDFLLQVRRESGIEIEIIEGHREGELVTFGVLAGLSQLPESCLIFDLGGGSLEITFVRAGNVVWVESYPIGVVGLADCSDDRSHQLRMIQCTLKKLEEDLRERQIWTDVRYEKVPMIGTAGTVSTLAAIDLELKNYDWRQINNHRLSRSRLEAIQRKLISITPVEIRQIPGMEAGREDLIVPGLEVVLALMDLCGRDHLIASDFGLLEGVLLGLTNV